MYQLTSKQKQMVMAIARERKVGAVMAQAFLRKYDMGANTVQGAIKVLLDRDFITNDDGCYQANDRFFAQYQSEH